MKFIFTSLSIIKKQLLFGLLLFVSILLYLITPEIYSHNWILIFSCLFLLTTYLFFTINNEKNFFSFPFIFSVAFFFTFFVYPLFVFPVNRYKFFMFAFDFNANIICKSTCLALIGFQSFVLGLVSFRGKNNHIRPRKYSLFLITLLLFICTILKIYSSVFLKVDSYTISSNANPNASAGMWQYFDIITFGITFAAIVLLFHNLFLNKNKFKWYLHNPLLWILLFIQVIVRFSTGGRNGALTILLMIIYGFLILKGKVVSLKKVLLLMFVGFILLNFLLIIRNPLHKVSFNILDLSMDLIINNYTLYLGYDYVQSEGYEPFSLFGSLFSAIPFLQGRIVDIFNIPIYETSSARFFSYLAMGEHPSFGVGTNIISALYLGIGFFGVLMMMFFLGYLVSWFRFNFSTSSIYKQAFGFLLTGLAIYTVRSDFFYPIGKLVFTLFFCFICSIITIRHKR